MQYRRDYGSEDRLGNGDSAPSRGRSNDRQAGGGPNSRRQSMNDTIVKPSVGGRPPLTTRRTTQDFSKTSPSRSPLSRPASNTSSPRPPPSPKQSSLGASSAMGPTIPMKGTLTSETTTDPRKRIRTLAKTGINMIDNSILGTDSPELSAVVSRNQENASDPAAVSPGQSPSAQKPGQAPVNETPSTQTQDRISAIVGVLLRFANDVSEATLLMQKQRESEDDAKRAARSDERNRRDFKDHVVLIEQGAEERRRAENRLGLIKIETRASIEVQNNSAQNVAAQLLQISSESSRDLLGPTADLKTQKERLEQLYRQTSEHDDKLKQLYSQTSNHAESISEAQRLSQSTQQSYTGLTERLHKTETDMKGLLPKYGTVQRLTEHVKTLDDFRESHQGEIAKLKLEQNQLQQSLQRPSTEEGISPAEFRSVFEDLQELRSQIKSQNEEIARLKQNRNSRNPPEEEIQTMMQEFKTYQSEAKMHHLKLSTAEEAAKKSSTDMALVNDEIHKLSMAIDEIRQGNTERDDVIANELDSLSAKLRVCNKEQASLSENFERHVRHINSTIQRVIDNCNEKAARPVMSSVNEDSQKTEEHMKVMTELAPLKQKALETSGRLAGLIERVDGNEHSIRSLNARFNNLTTQQMIDAVIQRVTKLFPYASTAQSEFSKLREDRASFEKLRNEHASNTVQLQTCTTSITAYSGKIDELESSRLDHAARLSEIRHEMLEARDKILSDLNLKEQSLQDVSEKQREFQEMSRGLFKKLEEELKRRKMSPDRSFVELSKQVEKLERLTESLVAKPSFVVPKPETPARRTATPGNKVEKRNSTARKDGDQSDREDDDSYLEVWTGNPAKNSISMARQTLDRDSESSDVPTPYSRGNLGESTKSHDIASVASGRGGKRKRPPYHFEDHENNDRSDDETYSETGSKATLSRRVKVPRKR